MLADASVINLEVNIVVEPVVVVVVVVLEIVVVVVVGTFLDIKIKYLKYS